MSWEFVVRYSRQALVGEEKIVLTRSAIFYCIKKNRNRVLTFEQIYAAVWHEEYLMNNSTIFFHVGNLRRKVRVGWIETRYGVGYYIHNPDKI